MMNRLERDMMNRLEKDMMNRLMCDLFQIIEAYNQSFGLFFLYLFFPIVRNHRKADFIEKVPEVYTHSMETIHLSLGHTVTASFIKPYRNAVYNCTGSR